MDTDFVIDEDVTKLSNDDLVSRYNEIESFLKLVNDEIKKTDIGDENEEN